MVWVAVGVVGVEDPRLRRDLLREEFVVVVKELNIRASRLRKAAVARCGGALVRLAQENGLQIGGACQGFIDDRRRRGIVIVIDDDDLQRTMGLRAHRSERLFQQVRPAIGRDDDGNERSARAPARIRKRRLVRFV